MSLGHQLRADDDVGGPLGDLHDLLLERAGRAEQVRRQHRDPRLREKRGRLLRQPLHPGADSGQPVLRAAGRASTRHRRALTALMADQPLLETVLDHPRIAMLTSDLMPAGPADRGRRIAAPVEKQQRLLPRRHPRIDRGLQCRRHPAVRRQRFGPHVDRRQFRHHRRPVTRLEIQPLVFPGLGIGPALKARRGRGQHHPRIAERRPQHGHVARIIKHAILLLVGTVMLLIHHDQAKVLKRQEQRRARAHHHLRRPLPDHLPRPPPLGHGDAGMPLGGARPEPRLDPCEKLRRQRDLRQKD
ncbi:hypothetical protein ROTO_28080 [Roseovarius tolerans]|uniref:Uncharacterized protein n=1 Tax=Roseovarius tolerans TaxID=74031 RepID=A0A0L6CSY5_9RHOB|nr:hypothetical protein ROTO_28080 [Roseovarius tolerans]